MKLSPSKQAYSLFCFYLLIIAQVYFDPFWNKINTEKIPVSGVRGRK